MANPRLPRDGALSFQNYLQGPEFRYHYSPCRGDVASSFYDHVQRLEFHPSYPHDTSEVIERPQEVSELIHKFEILWTDLSRVNSTEDLCEPESLMPSWLRVQEGSYGYRNQSGGGKGTSARGRDGGGQQYYNQGQQAERLGASATGSGRGQGGKRSKKNDPDDAPGPSKKQSTAVVPKPPTQYQCWIYVKSTTGSGVRCREKYNSFTKMLQHLLSIHIRPYQCTHCWQRYGRPSERNRHQISFCKRRQHSFPNEVPNYVVEFGQLILGCADTRALDGILYFGGRKQYDFLDGTDELEWASEVTYPGCPTIIVQSPVPQGPSQQRISPSPDSNSSTQSAPTVGTRRKTHLPSPLSPDPLIEEASTIGGTPTFFGNNEVSQPPLYDVPTPISEIPATLTSWTREELLAQVGQEFRLAQAMGPAAVRQLARQLVSRIPLHALDATLVYQNTEPTPSMNQPVPVMSNDENIDEWIDFSAKL